MKNSKDIFTVSNNKTKKNFLIGDKIRINKNLEGTIVNAHNSHGLCFEVQLDLRDYENNKIRTFFIDSNELDYDLL